MSQLAKDVSTFLRWAAGMAWYSKLFLGVRSCRMFYFVDLFIVTFILFQNPSMMTVKGWE